MPVANEHRHIALYRRDTFEHIGFSDEQADALATAPGLDGYLLSHHDVRRYLQQGATHDQVVRIFAETFAP